MFCFIFIKHFDLFVSGLLALALEIAAISNKFCNFVKLCLALLRRFVTKIRLGSYSNRRETRDHLDSLSLAFNTNK